MESKWQRIACKKSSVLCLQHYQGAPYKRGHTVASAAQTFRREKKYRIRQRVKRMSEPVGRALGRLPASLRLFPSIFVEILNDPPINFPFCRAQQMAATDVT